MTITSADRQGHCPSSCCGGADFWWANAVTRDFFCGVIKHSAGCYNQAAAQATADLFEDLFGPAFLIMVTLTTRP